MSQMDGPPLDYRRLFLASPNPYLVLAPDLTILDANAACTKQVGIPRAALVGRHVFEAVPARLEEAVQALRDSFTRVLETGQPDTLAIIHYPIANAAQPSGWEERYWRVENAPLLDATGGVGAILNCAIDVTALVECREAAEALAVTGVAAPLARSVGMIQRQLVEERERFRRLMEQAPGFLAILQGPHHLFELANHAYYQLIGHRDIVGRPVRDALPELEGQGFYELLDHVYASRKPYIGRAMPIQVQRAPGLPLDERYIDFIYQPIIGDDDTVSGIFVQGHDVTEAHELACIVSHQASHDVVTGLVNRREFERRLAVAVATLDRQGDTHGLLYLDLDQFKVINDTCGHATGDELLRQIGSLLAARIAPPHTLARLGGDEFGILLQDTDLASAQALAETLRSAIHDTEFAHERRTFGCAASVGVVCFGKEIGDPAGALSAADAACFLAKEKGRNRVQVHQPDDDELAERRREMDWVTRLRLALSEQRLVLYAQRIDSLSPQPDDTVRMELLVRLRETDGSIVPPMAFIPAAERYGYMPQVDRFVFQAAFEVLKGLSEAERARTQLSINLSGTTLNDPQLLSFIAAQLQDCPGCARHICIEITETAALRNTALSAKLMLELKALGFQFALDDFGSGMSSLGYLKHLPVDYLKIDGVFIREIESTPVDAAIVEAIARVAQVMGIRTVAEYVETDAARQLLARLGIDYVQGYGVHVPEPMADALRRAYAARRGAPARTRAVDAGG